MKKLWDRITGAKPAAAPKGETDWKRRRVFPRVRILPLHGFTFEPSASSVSAAAVRISNVSLGGLGLMRDDLSGVPEAADPKVGARFAGTLVIQKERFAAQLQIAHVSDAVVGCTFVPVTADSPISSDPAIAEVKAAIRKGLELELSALEMVAARPEMLEADPEGSPHWYSSAGGYELFYVISPAGELMRFHFAFFGYYVEGGKASPTRYGQLMEDPGRGKPGHKGSSLVRWDAALRPELAPLAQRFVQCLAGLPAEHARMLLAIFQE